MKRYSKYIASYEMKEANRDQQEILTTIIWEEEYEWIDLADGWVLYSDQEEAIHEAILQVRNKEPYVAGKGLNAESQSVVDDYALSHRYKRTYKGWIL